MSLVHFGKFFFDLAPSSSREIFLSFLCCDLETDDDALDQPHMTDPLHSLNFSEI